MTNFQLSFFLHLDELPFCGYQQQFIESAVRQGIPNEAAAAFFRVRNDPVTRTWIDDQREKAARAER